MTMNGVGVFLVIFSGVGAGPKNVYKLRQGGIGLAIALFLILLTFIPNSLIIPLTEWYTSCCLSLSCIFVFVNRV